MKNRWTIYQLIGSGTIGALGAVLSMLGAIISTAVGILGAGGLFNAVFMGMMFSFCCITIRKFGSATIAGLVLSICLLPFPSLGTPGFFPKILIGLSAGFMCDITFFFFKKNNKLFSIIVGAGSSILITLEVIGLGLLLSIPGIDETADLFFNRYKFLFLIFLFLGAIGGYIGYLLYSRLRSTNIMKKLGG